MKIFLHGKIERLINATESPKVLLVWLHGDEPLGAYAAHHIFTERPDLAQHVDYLCGNPKAAGSNPPTGFHKFDLNRSFGPAEIPDSYEKRRAKLITELCRNYDYVLDLHNAVDRHKGEADRCRHARQLAAHPQGDSSRANQKGNSHETIRHRHDARRQRTERIDHRILI